MAAPTFSSQFRSGGDSKPADASSVTAALDTLEAAATTPQQHSAIKTLRSAFASTPPQAKKDTPPSPGQRAVPNFAPSAGAGKPF